MKHIKEIIKHHKLMSISKQIVQKATQEGKMPAQRLQLGIKQEGGGVRSTGAHQVKFISDKVVMGSDFQGNQRHEVQYLFEENGQKKTYNVPVKNQEGQPHYFVIRMSECEEGEEIILEMKRRGNKNYIDFQRTVEPTPPPAGDDIPIVEGDKEPSMDKDVNIDDIPM